MYGTDGFVDDDELRQHIEEIRGKEIKVIDPSGDDWTEVSDAFCLCDRPVVSVVMITYNHEKFIGQALESIVSQKTDFDFECVIGEDCSTDGTREICLDYQRRYPHIVRVLYPRANTYRKYGSQVFNLAEVYRRCRGEFGAMCEGDDYWIDEFKLAKQVAVMREHPSVHMCWTRSKFHYQDTGRCEHGNVEKDAQWGIMPGREFWWKMCRHQIWNIQTPSVLWRLKPQRELYSMLRFPRWNLLVGDVPLLMTAGSLGDVFRMESVSAVYRIHNTSVCHTTNGQVSIDAAAVSSYLSYLLWHLPLNKFPYMHCVFRKRIQQIAIAPDFKTKVRQFIRLSKVRCMRKYSANLFCWLYFPCAVLGLRYDILARLLNEGFCTFVRLRVPDVPKRLYKLIRRQQ